MGAWVGRGHHSLGRSLCSLLQDSRLFTINEERWNNEPPTCLPPKMRFPHQRKYVKLWQREITTASKLRGEAGGTQRWGRAVGGGGRGRGLADARVPEASGQQRDEDGDADTGGPPRLED